VTSTGADRNLPRRRGGHRQRPAGRFAPLDGLRGIAVLAVFCYHAGVAHVPGGLLGVDLFFVISGYLITGLLVAERQRTGRLSFANFWGRRARRLLPAMVVMLTVTVLVWRFTATASVLLGLQQDAISTLFYFANWHFAFAGQSYFDHLSAPSPLLHMWSLAVEEQFYLLWPLVVWGVMRGRTAAAGRRLLRIVCLVGTAASTLTLVIMTMTGGDLSRIYYGTDTRALALLVGALLALYLPLDAGAPAKFTHRVGFALLGTAGAAGLVWCFVKVSGEASFLYHGGFLVVAIFGAAVLAGLVGAPRGPLSLAMLFPPLRQLGRISYGVYLWHWPVILFLTHARTGMGGNSLLALRAATTITISALSWTLVEQPVQRFARSRTGEQAAPPARRLRLASGVLGSAVTLAVVAAVVLAPLPKGLKATATSTALDEVHGNLGSSSSASSSSASSILPKLSPPPTSAAAKPGATVPTAAPVRTLMLGDSLAYTLQQGMSEVGPSHHATVDWAAMIGCGIAPSNPMHVDGKVAETIPECFQWEQTWQSFVDKDRPDVAIVMLGRWETVDRFWNGKWHAIGEPDYDAHLSAQLDTAIRIASSRGAKVALLDMPCFHARELPDGSTPIEDTAGRIQLWNKLLAQAAARHPGTAKVFNLDPLLCPKGKFTWKDAAGQDMRRDDGVHFTEAGGKDVGHFVLPKIVSWVRPQPATRPPAAD
jgi:peptidoglycan/LPS O-acetylase OafA/YrhL